MDIAEVTRAIHLGELDDSIEALYETLRLRARALRNAKDASMRAAVRIGDRVKIADGIKPKYLISVTGQVVKVDSKFVYIDVDDDQKWKLRRYSNKNLGIPAGAIEIIA